MGIAGGQHPVKPGVRLGSEPQFRREELAFLPDQRSPRALSVPLDEDAPVIPPETTPSVRPRFPLFRAAQLFDLLFHSTLVGRLMRRLPRIPPRVDCRNYDFTPATGNERRLGRALSGT